MRTIYIASVIGALMIAGSVYYTLHKPISLPTNNNAPVASAQAEEIKNEPLVGTPWVWLQTELADNTLLSTPEREKYVLTFDGSTLTSTTDCNSISGNYSQNGSSFKTEKLVSTEKACGASLDMTYKQELSKADAYSITGNRMYIMLNDKKTRMVFEKK